MRDVAREAGVAVETVYANFRSKSHLLMAAIDVNVVGDAEPVPLAQRPEFAALSEGSFTERVNATARLVTEINRRTSGLRRTLAEAAVSEPALAEQLALGDNRRRADVQRAAELITGRRMAPGETDGLWAVTSIEVFHLLTGSADWSMRQYTDWVAQMLGLTLSGGAGQDGRS
jgi:AcrR family transcriptional regulator